MAIHRNITRSEYEALPGINWSSLKAGNGRMGAHIRARQHQPLKDSQALKFGRAFHILVLQPELFNVAFTVIAGGKTTTKADALTDEDMRKLGGMREAWDELGLTVSERETALTWTYGGVECKGMIDGMESGAILDLKSTTNANPDAFAAECFKFLYHGQMAWYSEGLRKNGIEPDGARIVAIEKDEPFAYADFTLDPGWLDLGHRLADTLLEKYVDQSPATYGRVILPVPEWADSEPLELTIGGESVEM